MSIFLWSSNLLNFVLWMLSFLFYKPSKIVFHNYVHSKIFCYSSIVKQKLYNAFMHNKLILANFYLLWITVHVPIVSIHHSYIYVTVVYNLRPDRLAGLKTTDPNYCRTILLLLNPWVEVLTGLMSYDYLGQGILPFSYY